MSRAIIWRPAAQADLLELYDWIARQAGQATAYDYTAAIEDHAGKLADLPEWGPPRDDLAPGIRTITYRGRTTLAYRVLPSAIEIVRLAHAGRDLGRALADDVE